MKYLRRLRAPVLIAVAALVVILAVTALVQSRGAEVGEPPSSKAESLSPEELTSAYSALCTSRDLVEADLMAARDVFFSRAHGTLHLMASEISRRDRELAAELLESKNRVEQELSGVGPQTAADALDDLLSISKQALISLGMSSPSCPNQAA